VGYTRKNVDKKCWHHLKMLKKNVRNISKKCWWNNTNNGSKNYK
jgi:hypothetical protein